MIEDFGYEKEQKARFRGLFKRSFTIGAALFSILTFVFISVKAYKYVASERNKEVQTIKSPSFPIKVTFKSINSKKHDDSIYDDIFGSQKESLEQIIPKVYLAPEPVKPPKKLAKKKPKIKKLKKIKKKAKKKSENTRIVIYSEKDIDGDSSKELLSKNNSKKTSSYKKVKVQIAALSSQDAVNQYWKKLNRLNPGLFRNLRLYSKKADLGKRGVFYRVQIGNFANQISAEKFCEKYISQARKNRGDCIIVE